ncbi:Thioesterase superfamily protein isoform 2 [Theobroma cacao]|uniref:3-hydroxyacyl-[acyl-carrier-protein] dehydratase n=1 Tax=Theobroma cacao TaxID=3641 RepID=A0A061DI44_THECC|nr:Thioesterase superfamily protein isoform 2 [Theobroma cacao]
MAVTSNSLVSFTPGSLSQPRRLFQPLPSSSLSFPGSRSLSLKLTHRSNSALGCSLNVPNSTDNDAPIETRYPAFPTVMDINQIREILPHRFPFLLVDRVIEYNPGVSAVAIKNVTINDNFFPGHFPERPIMPGVLMVEAMAQVGGLVMLQPEVGGSRENFFFAGVDKVRFRKPVIAGDTLVMRMTLIKLQKRFGIAKMEGKAYVGGDLVCEVKSALLLIKHLKGLRFKQLRAWKQLLLTS